MCFVFDEMYLLACLLGGVYWEVFCLVLGERCFVWSWVRGVLFGLG